MGKRFIESQPVVTKHAIHRMSERSIKEWQIEQVLSYGRKAYCNRAIVYTIGRKEVKAKGRFLEPCEGIHVLYSLNDGSVITTYRNHDLKGLRNQFDLNKPRNYKGE